jgi:choline-sulfatase
MSKREDKPTKDGITRSELLKAAAAGTGAMLLSGTPAASARTRVGPYQAAANNPIEGMNVIVFLTDQQRAIQHFPAGWAQRNLPGYTRLQRNGVTFDNACTNACMCSPARSTFLSGYFPAQHGVKYTLEENMSPPQNPQVELDTSFKNFASVTEAAGYTPVYKGKFHCTKQANGSSWQPSDVNKYGFTRWDPPDAGANQSAAEEGGGTVNNDGRFINSQGTPQAGTEGVIDYLTSAARGQEPFFMVVSLVNPHDVLFYPNNLTANGYDESWLQGEIGLPATAVEDLSTKPTVQEQFLRISRLLGRLTTPQQKRNYLNFYGNVIKSSDAYLVQILDTLTRERMLDNTLMVATADHGEMGMSHNGMRQKNFNFYEETVRIPLVYSNQRMWRRPEVNHSLVSHVDFLPTLASLVGAPRSARAKWQGVDYSAQILRRSARPPQDYTVFTYDDYQSGQPHGPYPQPPNHITSIRERRFKFARYYDANGNVPDQFEMYDLRHDPNERHNIAYKGFKRTPTQEREYRRLRAKLAHVEKTRLQPL